jgi:hypothetical protein
MEVLTTMTRRENDKQWQTMWRMTNDGEQWGERQTTVNNGEQLTTANDE